VMHHGLHYVGYGCESSVRYSVFMCKD
jgi:hypothetical protein